MDTEVTCRKVSIRPIELLKSSKDLLGDQFWLFVGITFVGVMIGSAVPMGIIMGPMFCGIYLCYIQRAKGQQASFETLFKGFDYFVESLLATLIMVGVSMLVTIPAMIVFFVLMIASMAAGGGGEPGPEFLVTMLLFYPIFFFLIILISIPFMFVYPLITERGLKAVPAVKASFQGVKANFFGLLMMILLYTFLNLIATCMCYVPAILFMPILFGAIFLAYRQIYPLDGDTFTTTPG